MLIYSLQLAAGSLKKNAGLTLILVLGLSLGVVSWAGTKIALDAFEGLHATDERLLFQTRLERKALFADVAAPVAPAFDRGSATLLAFRDFQALARLAGPIRRSPLHSSEEMITPVAGTELPRRVLVRFIDADAFSMQRVRFRFGGPWRGAQGRVIVLDDATNRGLFGDEDSVGRSVRIGLEDFTVTGVLEPPPGRPPGGSIAYVPFAELMARRTRTRLSWDVTTVGPTFEDLVASENGWIELWVEFADDTARRAFASSVDAYVAEERAAGRPIERASLVPIRELHGEAVARHPADRLFHVVALLLLGANALNASRLLLVKYRARAAEIGVHRAFGASRKHVFLQHLLEAVIVGVGAGVVAIGGTAIVVRVMNAALPVRPADYALDGRMALEALGLSIAVSVVSALYPAWWSCRRSPAVALRRR